MLKVMETLEGQWMVASIQDGGHICKVLCIVDIKDNANLIVDIIGADSIGVNYQVDVLKKEATTDNV